MAPFSYQSQSYENYFNSKVLLTAAIADSLGVTVFLVQ